MINQKKETKKELKISKLKISKKAIVKPQSTMAGCGRSIYNDCGTGCRAG